MTITVLVKVSIPVTLEYDIEPSKAKLRRDALENFLAHPALNEYPGELAVYLDRIEVIA